MSGKKSVLSSTNFTPTQESPTLTPLPPLAKIGDQLYHGGGFTSSDALLTKKRPHQRITYPLGSMLMRAFLFMLVLAEKLRFLPLKTVSTMMIIMVHHFTGNVLLIMLYSPHRRQRTPIPFSRPFWTQCNPAIVGEGFAGGCRPRCNTNTKR